ncbi:MAG: putative membrane protein YfcA [Verrucomicrobiales bacterium]|jgi:uncharacterized membrane protein YfcA
MDVGLALGLFILALGVGIYGTIIGAGGGFVMVAGLVLIFDLSGAEAVGTSVITTLFIQLTGAITYDRAGMIDRPTVRWFATGSIPVAFLSAALLANRIPERLFGLLIGALLLSLAVFVVVRPGPQDTTGAPLGPRKPQLVGLGSTIGVLSGAFGVGAGLLTVPAIRSLQKLSTHRAAATTTAIGAASSFAAALGHILAKNPRWSFAPFVIAGAIIGGRIGSNSAGKLSQRTVGVLLAGGLFAAGAPLLFRAI